MNVHKILLELTSLEIVAGKEFIKVHKMYIGTEKAYLEFLKEKRGSSMNVHKILQELTSLEIVAGKEFIKVHKMYIGTE